MRRFQWLLWSTGFLLLSGCANALYQADLRVPDADGEPRVSRLYWSRTDPLIGAPKAGPIILLTACSTRTLTFDETEAGIVYRGVPGLDRYPGGGGVAEGEICGEVETDTPLVDLGGQSLPVSIHCEAEVDEFSLAVGEFTPSYLPARETPYRFDVQESTSWSLFGRTPQVSPPEC